MGLDQYAYIKLFSDQQVDKLTFLVVISVNDRNPLEFELKLDQPIYNIGQVDIAYWRKHPDLQGWMERLWRKRIGKLDNYRKDTTMDNMFNCVELSLTFNDISKLEKDIKDGNLDEGYGTTTGFFFGDQKNYEYKERDLTFCHNAKVALAAGLIVCYNSSW